MEANTLQEIISRAPKVNPQLAVELVFQELKRVEAYTKRIEDERERIPDCPPHRSP